MSAALLEVSGLKVDFRTLRGIVKALDGVDLVIEKREIVGLVGESGCGKTITGMAALGLLPKPQAVVTGGQVLFAGQDILKMDERQLRQVRGRDVSMVFQDPFASLNPVFSIGDQITRVVVEHGKCSRSEARDRARKALGDVGLPVSGALMSSYPHQLSGGMRQRVCMAMAISCDSPLLIADEPTTALDVTIQMQILRLLLRFRNDFGVAQLLITHNVGVAAQTCDRIAVMYAGQVVEQGPTVEIVKRPRHPYTLALYACLPHGKEVGQLETIPGSVPDLIDPPTGCRFHPRCVRAMEICAVQKPATIEVAERHTVACHWVAGRTRDARHTEHR
jgi:oligopeptide/dipeptide ABC transporter ATP-binding protein